MKKHLIIITLLSMLMLTGCAKYQEDTSYETDLYGTYLKQGETVDKSYSITEKYTFNPDETYIHIKNEILDGKTIDDSNKSGEIISHEEISDNLFEIMLEGNTEFLHKYKNMLGSFDEVVVPNGKTFDLRFEDGTIWFDKDGQTHSCIDKGTCECKEYDPQYVRKNDVIYFKSLAEESGKQYTITFYITDNGIFYPEMYKQ